MQSQVSSSIDTLATIYKVFGWFQIVIGFGTGCLSGVSMIVPGLLEGDEEAALVLGGIGIFVAIFVVFLVSGMGALSVVVGGGLQRRASWSRLGAMILGGLSLFSFPLGTVIGVYTLVTLLKPEAEAEFRGM